MDVTFSKDVDFSPVGPVKAGDTMRPGLSATSKKPERPWRGSDQGENQRRNGLRFALGSRRETVLHERERETQT